MFHPETMAEFMRHEFAAEPPAPECIEPGCTQPAGADFELVGEGYTCNPCGLQAWNEIEEQTRKGNA